MAESVELPSRLAILPFRNKVLLPGAIIRIRCTSPTSVKLVEQELWQREEKGMIGILPVRDAAEVKPVGPTMSQGLDSLDQSSKLQGGSSDSHKPDIKNQNDVHWHNRGVAARALHLSRGVEKPSGRVTYIVVLEGLCRFSVQELSTRGTYHTARISSLEMTKIEMEHVEQDPDFIMLSRQFKATAMELISLLEQKQKTGGRTKVLLETVPVQKLADIFVASFEISFEEQLSMLDAVDPKVRLSKATELVDRHLQSIRVAEKISQKVEGQLSKSQKEFLLRQQMRAIKEELGDDDDDEDDLEALERKMESAGMPQNIWKHSHRELRRLKKMQPQQPGYSSSRAYLELLADLPWQKASKEIELDLRAAKERLDRDHYGLVKVKQRIIEYLAVRKLKPDARGPVLCFVGPPGVGKTSLASSIAVALGRKFVRISLGGVKDEADIRGHRRTYIGSMPGRLIDGLKGMVKLVIQRYTREAGVRNLERNLASLARAAAVRVAEQEQFVPLNKGMEGLATPLMENRLADSAEVEMEVIPMDVNNQDISSTFRVTSPLVVDEAMLEKVLGPPKFDGREAEQRVATPGVSVGLVWTSFGGEVQFVEATAMVGKGELHLTGQLGDVIKESAQIALTWVRTRAADLRLAAAEGINLLEGRDVHIHFPAGAVPKDGPSAGVTLVTALVSLFSQKRMRADTAMTGEMTLRGLVLPVGGIKDKILAAHRYGIKRVILPEKNLKDLAEVPSSVLNNLEIHLAKRMEDVLEQAFEGGCPWRQHSKL
ncbi:Lon protease 2, peroxisomal [Stylosanthes scabra]|uniref:Lon protease homolog n=1 Tax=Stylosanthes scabra TaxID=79078 RepID=A0ABU6QHM9_9FABA|nr:Lon protease 2, peroxisomal [Stylosanthes scabra]